MLAWIQIIAGLILLVGGAELLVKGASALALRFGLTPLAVGLTVVAYGTSAPELAVSLSAALKDSPGLVVGNVIGSNLANLGLVLGLAAVIRPLAARASLLKQEVPFLLVSAVVVPIAALGGVFTRLDGVLMLCGAVVFSVFCFTRAKTNPDTAYECVESPPRHERPPLSVLAIVALLIAGVAGLSIGSSFLVEGAVTLATAFGVSDHVIGLTLVALGTSLPELATCVVSAVRGQVDLVVGNVIGSNIFNVFLILGGTAAAHPIVAPVPLLGLDVVVMLVLSFALVPFILTGARISRTEGALYLAAYAGFMALLFTVQG